MKGNQKRNRTGITLFMLFMVSVGGALLWSSVNKGNNEESLKENWVIYNNATITKVKFPLKSGSYVAYTYKVQNTEYKGHYSLGTRANRKKYYELINQSWNIIYDSTDHSNSALLLSQKDYNYWHVPYLGQRIVEFEQKN